LTETSRLASQDPWSVTKDAVVHTPTMTQVPDPGWAVGVVSFEMMA